MQARHASSWTSRLAASSAVCASLLLGACGGGSFGGGVKPSADGNPSPLAGSALSQQINQQADSTMNRQVAYTNAAKKGPRIIVLPGTLQILSVPR